MFNQYQQALSVAAAKERESKNSSLKPLVENSELFESEWFSGLTVFQQKWVLSTEGETHDLGMHKYDNGGMEAVGRYVTENPKYYMFRQDVEIIKHFAESSVGIINEFLNQGISSPFNRNARKITIVSRGPGTTFGVKEGQHKPYLDELGIEVAGVVLIDGSNYALERSEEEARLIYPGAKRYSIQGDIYHPHDYPVVGLEYNTMFGGTTTNSQYSGGVTPPVNKVTAKFERLAKITSPNAHLVSTNDMIDHPRIAEEAYEDAGGLFKEVMLRYHLGWSEEQISKVDYISEFHDASNSVRQFFHFREKIPYELNGRELFVNKRSQMCIENSIKLPPELNRTAQENGGWVYADPPGVMTLPDNNMGFHHTYKP